MDKHEFLKKNEEAKKLNSELDALYTRKWNVIEEIKAKVEELNKCLGVPEELMLRLDGEHFNMVCDNVQDEPGMHAQNMQAEMTLLDMVEELGDENETARRVSAFLTLENIIGEKKHGSE